MMMIIIVRSPSHCPNESILLSLSLSLMCSCVHQLSTTKPNTHINNSNHFFLFSTLTFRSFFLFPFVNTHHTSLSHFPLPVLYLFLSSVCTSSPPSTSPAANVLAARKSREFATRTSPHQASALVCLRVVVLACNVVDFDGDVDCVCL